MELLQELEKYNMVKNTKGSYYYRSTYNYNLDLFTKINRFHYPDEVIRLFHNAIEEDKTLALANLLYLLDIRGGKGERYLFKTIYRYLCNNNKEEALKILPWIGELGRYDYILVGIDTPVEEETMKLIKEQLELDQTTNTPSLLAKWLPSHRTHSKNNELAKKIMKHLHMAEKQYRKMLSSLRSKINIVEKNLTEKKYENIDFSEVPARAMLKYNTCFDKKIGKRFRKYKDSVSKGEKKINTTGLYSYEIIKKLLYEETNDKQIYDLMWKNQKDILKGNTSNVLVVADTSGSMTDYDSIPICNSLGLAIYIAERNHGIFKDYFITFSDNPTLQKLKGKTISDKVKNIKSINPYSTDIDKVFQLLLDVSKRKGISQEELPSHIIIISDMEFDYGVYSKNKTNLQGWKEAFQKEGYILPTIIFWNVAGRIRGVPATKFDHDVAMISGFSTNVLENLLTLENYTPQQVMLEKLAPYVEKLKIF